MEHPSRLFGNATPLVVASSSAAWSSRVKIRVLVALGANMRATTPAFRSVEVESNLLQRGRGSQACLQSAVEGVIRSALFQRFRGLATNPALSVKKALLALDPNCSEADGVDAYGRDGSSGGVWRASVHHTSTRSGLQPPSRSPARRSVQRRELGGAGGGRKGGGGGGAEEGGGGGEGGVCNLERA